eukprot:CAMPEP_0115381592 /NCGR_PEP_ID=MMETSP0271-20121206/5653_1 /TAXON_ID=71861 /ORGANISM="Scrippsiella trochoidea, Strain CCMP3099" /LENGTH=46 /DNA_ID= /DNA_START= /DNA_END= /DNA_ORIENTATION=
MAAKLLALGALACPPLLASSVGVFTPLLQAPPSGMRAQLLPLSVLP